MTTITVLHQAESEVPGPEGKPQILTYITYKDENGRIGMVTVPKKNPTDREIAETIKKQQKEEAARTPREIYL